MENPPSLSRRRFAGLSLAASAASLLPASRARAATPGAELLETKVISPQASYYHGWPTLTHTKKGELVVVWSGRREAHVCPFGTVEMMTSRDEWSELDLSPHRPRRPHRRPRRGGARNGQRHSHRHHLHLARLRSRWWPRAGARPRIPPGSRAHARIADEETREGELGCWGFRSTDRGLSFSGRIDTIVNSPHGPCQLADGRLLYAGKELWTEEKRIGVSVSTRRRREPGNGSLKSRPAKGMW
jgi:sialidase-1